MESGSQSDRNTLSSMAYDSNQMDPKFLRNLRRAKKNDPKQNKHIKPKAAKVEKKEAAKGKKDAKAKIPKDKAEAKKETKKDAKPKA
jgi:hypothetical protein